MQAPATAAVTARFFGDDTADYAEALKTHYEKGVPATWREDFISGYATTHAWEDFAETWAHYLHIIDSLEMARAFGMAVRRLSSPRRSRGLQSAFP